MDFKIVKFCEIVILSKMVKMITDCDNDYADNTPQKQT